MSDDQKTALTTPPITASQVVGIAWPKALIWFAVLAVGLTLAFLKPLLAVVSYSLKTELHSHAVLIPFISAYLIWLQRRQPLPPVASSPALAVLPLAFGLAALKFLLFPSGDVSALPLNDYLALAVFSYLSFLWAGGLLLLGGRFLGAYSFPAAFLIFVVPLPTAFENALEYFFQHSSAEAANLMFGLAGMTYYRDGLIFQLPNITIQVAPECSGIRSSLVLFITSLLAGHMFLQSRLRRSVLTLFVIPLGIIRNGFRIFTIGMLCVHVSPTMIDSPIHHRGGPLFFALSLIPFFILLLWLRHREMRLKSTSSNVASGPP